MLRIIIAVSLGATVLFFGINKSKKLSVKVQTCEELAAAASRIIADIKYRRLFKPELLTELPFDEIEAIDCNNEYEIAEYLSECTSVLSKKEIGIISSFVASLGYGNIDEEICLTSAFRKFWEEALEKAKQEKTAKSRLFLSLGALGGLAVTIILI